MQTEKADEISADKFKRAFEATARKRKSTEAMRYGESVIARLAADENMKRQWKRYQQKYDYATLYNWDDIMEKTKSLLAIV